MVVTYTYNYPADFPNGLDLGILSTEINTSPITKILSTIVKNTNNVKIKFNIALSTSELVYLNNIITAHGRSVIHYPVENVHFTTNPTALNCTPDYTIGTIWINTTTDIIFILVDDTLNNAIWEQINNEYGPTGPQGHIGITGPTGSQGLIGPTGTNGTNGLNGATGPQGPQGSQGIQGVTGPTGPQGPQGSILSSLFGPPGPPGPQGTQGPQGSQGAQGVPGTSTSGVLNYTTVNSSTYNILNTNEIVGVIYTTTGTVTLTLPLVSGLSTGKTFHIKDQGFNCKNNNITINTSGSDTIDSQSNLILKINGISVSLYANGDDKYFLY